LDKSMGWGTKRPNIFSLSSGEPDGVVPVFLCDNAMLITY
jgi:hypothetical protein